MVVVRFKVTKPTFSQKFSSTRLIKEVKAAGAKWAGNLIATGRVYPPPKAGSRYRRTYTLHDSWNWHQGESGNNLMWWEVEVTATDPYGFHYTNKVIGDTQDPMHAATGWQKFSDQAKESEADFVRLMDAAFDKWAGG
jgi:hypothetical protein